MLVERQVHLKDIIMLLTESGRIKPSREDRLFWFRVIIAIIIISVSDLFLEFAKRQVGATDFGVLTKCGLFVVVDVDLEDVECHVMDGGDKVEGLVGMVAEVLCGLCGLGDVLKLQGDLGPVVEALA